jgi:uncharacterized membrane protein
VNKILLAVIIFILLSSRAYSMNLGSAQRSDYASIDASESAKFKMLFWNSGNDTYMVNLTVVDYPKDWTVIVDPQDFYLSKSTGEEQISLPYTQEIVMAKAVSVYVKPDSSSPSGLYSVSVSAQTKMPEMQTSGMNMVSEKIFKFKINLSSTATSEKEIDNVTVEHSFEAEVGKNSTMSVVTQKEEGGSPGFAIAVILVAAASIIIYKKYK